MAKKYRSIFDTPLSELPDFGPGVSPQKGNLSLDDRKRFLSEMQNANAAMDAQRAQENAIHAQQMQAMKLAQLQAQNTMAQMNASLANLYRPLPSTKPPRGKPSNMNEDMTFLYEVGDRVTVRTGKTIFNVMKMEPYNDGYSNFKLYYLEDDKGNQTRENEVDLKPTIKKSKVDFDTVIISDEKRQQIIEAIEQVNSTELIFTTWGFGETIEKGRGVSMLFYGPPGTGKTLMAQAIANKLNYVLKIISTADIESSAPGEAERNIRKHFKEAKNGKTILLFDECDSLIFDRAGTGPILSAQINELLSQIERFDGITLFTTNRLGTLDEAVNRRLALKLEFAMPSQEERAKIWERMFPIAAPVADDVDWMRLAIVEMTGGYIKNAVLRAARMAAIEPLPDEEKQIKMKHLIRAVELEATSMDEFEKARKQHAGGIGYVKRGPNGQNVVTTEGVGMGQDMEMKEGVEENANVGSASK